MIIQKNLNLIKNSLEDVLAFELLDLIINDDIEIK
jgi:hypothetical protein